MSAPVFCRVCCAAHERTPLYACQSCGEVLCPSRTELLLTGRHWVRVHGRARVCGMLVRTEVRSDMTIETVRGGLVTT